MSISSLANQMTWKAAILSNLENIISPKNSAELYESVSKLLR